jgi:hypothetical protein
MTNVLKLGKSKAVLNYITRDQTLFMPGEGVAPKRIWVVSKILEGVKKIRPSKWAQAKWKIF